MTFHLKVECLECHELMEGYMAGEKDVERVMEGTTLLLQYHLEHDCHIPDNHYGGHYLEEIKAILSTEGTKDD